MKTVLIFAVLVAVTFAASAPIVSFTEHQDKYGQFTLSYVTADGARVSQRGVLKPSPDGKNRVIVFSGDYEFVDRNNELVKVSYVANENGFQPDVWRFYLPYKH